MTRASWRSLLVAIFAALATCPAVLVAQQDGRETPGKIDVLLTTAPTLSKIARAAMLSEAAALWRQHGVILEWLLPTALRPIASNRLRVLVVQKRLAVDAPEKPVPVGELLRPPNGHPVALISIEGAQHLMSSVRGRAGYELITIDERRLGIVMGRALAHEIGHYLLDTHTHASTGLMRPHFNALEFTDLRNGTFALDHAAAAWLRTRDVEKFTYARR